MRRLFSFLLAVIFLFLFSSCDSNDKIPLDIKPTEAPTEKPTELPESEKTDAELLREWIEYADGSRDIANINFENCYFDINIDCTESGIIPMAAYNCACFSNPKVGFPARVPKDTVLYDQYNVNVSAAPAVFKDNEIFPDASGEFTYVAFIISTASGNVAISPLSIKGISLKNGVLDVSLDLYTGTDNHPTDFTANMTVLKLKTADITEDISSLNMTVKENVSFDMAIIEPDGKAEKNFSSYPMPSSDILYIISIFDSKIEKGTWSEELTFDCAYEFNARSVQVNFTDLIFAENQKCYALDKEVAAFLESVSALPVFAKPVIYLYPEEDILCSVELEFDGTITATYPDYSKGWQNFVAKPDGTLVFPNGKEYYCLYWEGISPTFRPDLSKGFCVKGENTAEFLENALADMGLTPREANEFIIFWLPILQENAYNVITFQTSAYEDVASLKVSPSPDSMLRIYMYAYASSEYVNIEPQIFDAFARVGFTVVEWGGTFNKK